MAELKTTIRIIGDTLSLGERASSLHAGSALLGAIPELDSMAVVGLITALEEHYGVTFDDDEISAETFETVSSVHELVCRKLGA
jgi:acyl carrier protein